MMASLAYAAQMKRLRREYLLAVVAAVYASTDATTLFS
jgi:hypothetical protein